MMRHRARVARAIVTAAVTLAFAAPAAATMSLQRLPLETVTSEAGRIVHGKVTDVRSGTDESGTPATWVTFDVTRTLKGERAARVTVKQFGRADGAIGRIPGVPLYAPGEEVIVFLRPEGARGFTSPVGFEDGVYRVTAPDGRRTVHNGAGDTRTDVDAFIAEVERLVAAQRR
jgi:hypothetical protein